MWKNHIWLSLCGYYFFFNQMYKYAWATNKSTIFTGMVFVWMYKRARFSWWEGTIWMGVFIVQITQPFPMYQRSIVWWDVMLPTQLNYSIGPCPFYEIITLLHFKYRYTYYYYSSKLTLIESTYIDLPLIISDS